MITCFLFAGCDNRIQQCHLLFRWTIQFLNVAIGHICVDTGNSLCQLTLSFFCFRIMDNYIDWSTLSCDTTHLPDTFSLCRRSCPLCLGSFIGFPTSKVGNLCYKVMIFGTSFVVSVSMSEKIWILYAEIL